MLVTIVTRSQNRQDDHLHNLLNKTEWGGSRTYYPDNLNEIPVSQDGLVILDDPSIRTFESLFKWISSISSIKNEGSFSLGTFGNDGQTLEILTLTIDSDKRTNITSRLFTT